MIRKITISDFKGIESAEFDCSKFVIFSGNSLQGKTTVLQAIRWCFTGGDDDFIVRTGKNTCEVILHCDNHVRIERRLTRGGKNKLFVYVKEMPIEKPQMALNKNYNPFLFGPTDLLAMKPKELNEFIAEALSKRLKLTDEQISKFSLEEIDREALDVDPVQAITKHYDDLYSKRTEINRTVKSLEAKATVKLDKPCTKKEIDEFETQVETIKKALDAAKENNTRIEVGKKNAEAKSRIEAQIKTLTEEIDKIPTVNTEFDIESAKKSLQEKKDAVSRLEKEMAVDKSKHATIQETLKKLENGQPKCPISESIVCTTDMKPFIEDMKIQAEEFKKSAILKFDEAKILSERIVTIENTINSSSLIKTKKLELERSQSILNELQVINGETVDITELEKTCNESVRKLNDMKIAFELSTNSGLEDVKKRANELDAKVKSVDNVLKTNIPELLKLNVKDVSMTKDGIFYKGIPIQHEGDSAKLRICTSILKDLFPKANIFNLDRMECIDQKQLEKYVNYYSEQTDTIQYFGTFVGNPSFEVNKNTKVFTLEKFKIKVS